MTTNSSREKIKARQSHFLRSLFLPTEQTPDELDADRLDAVRESLLHKRSATIVRHWPHLHQALGDQWDQHFQSHFRKSAQEFEDNALTDGLRFARAVTQSRQLTNNATEELVAAELRHDLISVLRHTSEGGMVFGFRVPHRNPIVLVWRGFRASKP